MKKIGVAIIGFGNIGKSAVKAVQDAGDMELKGIVEISSCLDDCRQHLPEVLCTEDICNIKDVDIAVLCLPSVLVPKVAISTLNLGIGTVDCFDMHGDDLLALKKELQGYSVENQVVSVSAAYA